MAVLSAVCAAASAQKHQQTVIDAGGVPESGSAFGTTLDVHAEWLLIGAPGANGGSGVAVFFERVGGLWVQSVGTDQLADEGQAHRIGSAVALGEQHAVVASCGGEDEGMLLFFARQPSGVPHDWVLVDTEVIAPFPDFVCAGVSLALDSSRLAVGMHGTWGDDQQPGGSVRVYETAGNNWFLVESKVDVTDRGLGAAVALDGDMLAVGVPFDDGAGNDAGLIEVYDLGMSTIVNPPEIVLGGLQPGAMLGSAVGTAAGVVFGGSPGWGPDAGRVDGWDVTSSPPVAVHTMFGQLGWRLGAAVAVDGAFVAAGAPGADSPGLSQVGEVLVSRRGGPACCGVWSPLGVASVPHPTEGFGAYGTSVAIDATTLLAGAPFAQQLQDDVGSVESFGLPLIEIVGQGLAGVGGLVPFLDGVGTLCPGEPFALMLQDVLPDAAAVVVVGLTQASLPFKGGVLIPQPDVFLLAFTSADGGLFIEEPWPTVPVGTLAFMQAWLPDAAGPVGWSASNGLKITAL